MTTPTHPPITITGNVYDRYHEIDPDHPGMHIDLALSADQPAPQDEVIIMGQPFVPVARSFEAGDIAIYQKLDADGRSALAGGHTNYGYSGYFRASVFDGRGWRSFKIWGFIPEADRKYATQHDVASVKQRLTARLENLAGTSLVWRNRTYELGNNAV